VSRITSPRRSDGLLHRPELGEQVPAPVRVDELYAGPRGRAELIHRAFDDKTTHGACHLVLREKDLGNSWCFVSYQLPMSQLPYLRTLARDWCAHGVAFVIRDGEPLLTASGLPKRGVITRDELVDAEVIDDLHSDITSWVQRARQRIALADRMERERAAVRCL